MTVISRIRREDPTDMMSKMDALQDAVNAAMKTFKTQFEIELVIDGMPGAPDPKDVLYGSTLAITNDTINYQYACVFPEKTAHFLTRELFAMEEDEPLTMEDMGDALNEIPNVAAGVWKAVREKKNEEYQLGLPIFLKGNSWITFFPRGINAISQKLKGPDGLSLQVILIWKYGTTNAGGEQQMTTNTAEVRSSLGASVPAQVLQEAVKAVVDTLVIQVGLEIEVDSSPSDPREANVEYGSAIALTSENGGWQLAVMASQDSCNILTKALFAMEDDEEPEMADLADAIGEVANVAAGVLKASRAKAGQAVQLGLPLFMQGSSCIDFFASGITGMAQTIRGDGGMEAHVIIIWQEG